MCACIHVFEYVYELVYLWPMFIHFYWQVSILSFFLSFSLSVSLFLLLPLLYPFSHPPTHPPTHSLTHSLTHSFIHSFIHSLICPPTRPPTHWLTGSLSHWLTGSLTYSFIPHYLSTFPHRLPWNVFFDYLFLVSIALQITYTEKYPDEAPQIVLSNPSGLNEEEVTELLQKLEQQVKLKWFGRRFWNIS